MNELNARNLLLASGLYGQLRTVNATMRDIRNYIDALEDPYKSLFQKYLEQAFSDKVIDAGIDIELQLVKDGNLE